MVDALATGPQIRPDYPEPLWVQAAALIEGEISSGALRAGARLPPERELCQQLDISRVTLRKALGHLVERGLLSPSHGRGWYVSADRATSASAPQKDWPNSLESFTETAERMGLPATSIVLRADTVRATLDESERLSVAPGTPLFVLERIRRLDGVPIAVDETRFSLALAPAVESADLSEGSIYRLLEAEGVDLHRAETTIEAKAVDERIAAHLGVEAGHPMLVMSQLVTDAESHPVLESTIRYSGDRYRLRTQFTRAAR
ncbi:GntR family transcriptional regulator [Microbacterium aoyamense]|uniref:GntR family transcriptional regulator n=1 Tax=Microbacterium aoyamense TaxID=344166 RepID=A0ABN2PL74_9MICO|nr:GntR family transcriptional regulator [Microbacterium aoyamense]